MSLETLVPGRIWHAQYPITFGFLQITTRTTLIRLADGAIWVHSPIPPSPELLDSIGELGPVKFVIAPNKSHHLFFLPFLRAFPQADGYIAPGLAAKRPDLANFSTLPHGNSAPWAAELDSVFIEGLPIIDETVWFHRDTGTLILTDLLFCCGAEQRLPLRMVSRMLGVYRRLSMSRTMKLLIRDKDALSVCVEKILAWDVQRIVIAHGEIIENNAKQRLAEAFDSLL